MKPRIFTQTVPVSRRKLGAEIHQCRSVSNEWMGKLPGLERVRPQLLRSLRRGYLKKTRFNKIKQPRTTTTGMITAVKCCQPGSLTDKGGSGAQRIRSAPSNHSMQMSSALIKFPSCLLTSWPQEEQELKQLFAERKALLMVGDFNHPRTG